MKTIVEIKAVFNERTGAYDVIRTTTEVLRAGMPSESAYRLAKDLRDGRVVVKRGGFERVTNIDEGSK